MSWSSLPADLPLPTRHWVDGFLAGNMPRQPDAEDDDPVMLRWEQKRDRYFETGTWPQDPPDDE